MIGDLTEGGFRVGGQIPLSGTIQWKYEEMELIDFELLGRQAGHFDLEITSHNFLQITV